MLNRDEYQARWILAQGWLGAEVLGRALRGLSAANNSIDLCEALLNHSMISSEQARQVRAAAARFMAEQFQTQETMRSSDTQDTVITRPPAQLQGRPASPPSAEIKAPRSFDPVYELRGYGRSSPSAEMNAVSAEVYPNSASSLEAPTQAIPAIQYAASQSSLEMPSFGNLGLPSAPNASGLPAELLRRYEVLGEINRGSMGAILRARDKESNRLVALKFMLNAQPDPTERARFQQEAEVLVQLKHPHIIDILDCGFVEDTLYFAMDLIEGRDLRQLVENNLSMSGEPITSEQLLHALRDIAQALVYCHQRDIVHRDVKPQNVVVTRDLRRAVLVDFGLMKRGTVKNTDDSEVSTAPSSMGLTNPDDVVGTPAYMSPEQLTPGGEWGDVGPKSDVWGFGATLFFAFSGLPPFNQATVVEVFQALASEEAPRLRALVPDAPEWVDELCAACLQKRPHRRPDMISVLRVLEERLAEPQPSQEIEPPERPSVAWLLLVILGLAASISGVYFWLRS